MLLAGAQERVYTRSTFICLFVLLIHLTPQLTSEGFGVLKQHKSTTLESGISAQLCSLRAAGTG